MWAKGIEVTSLIWLSYRGRLCYAAEEHRRPPRRHGQDVLRRDGPSAGVPAQLWDRAQRPEARQVSSDMVPHRTICLGPFFDAGLA